MKAIDTLWYMQIIAGETFVFAVDMVITPKTMRPATNLYQQEVVGFHGTKLNAGFVVGESRFSHNNKHFFKTYEDAFYAARDILYNEVVRCHANLRNAEEALKKFDLILYVKQRAGNEQATIADRDGSS